MSFMCSSSTHKGEGEGKGNTDNSVETIVFGNTEISHPFNHTVPEQNAAGIYKIVCCRFTSTLFNQLSLKLAGIMYFRC